MSRIWAFGGYRLRKIGVEEEQGMEGHSMMGSKTESGSMMDECKAMMAKRQAMMDQMEGEWPERPTTR